MLQIIPTFHCHFLLLYIPVLQILVQSVFSLTLVSVGEGISANQQVLPSIRRTLPQADPGHSVGRDTSDDMLESMFPGQFFTTQQISEINALETGGQRRRRQTDQDICCRTSV